jgi:chromosome partition protein MukB
VTRAKVRALALVNWKGVFYERYQLDRHVTALEGANGAGKTTVMIAAYVVLLPDMSRLRFTNLGESGATGGDRGIWGRLGEPGRPAYAALDIQLADGGRLVAGVRLSRKGEPTVEPTAFAVTGLAPDVALQDLLLVRGHDADSVPELDELRASAQRLGGALEVFRTTRDYFAALFDRGVTPLRLTSDEDRRKLNEMLRTSMTGGISRALTSELRDFLLKQESGLADTLDRVRANLAACARTRAEVGEARALERDIAGVYAAGLHMFASAALAVRRAAEHHRASLSRARIERDRAERERAELARAVDHDQTRRDDASRRLAEARAALDRLGEQRDRQRRREALAARLAAIDAELAERAARAASARAALDDADATLGRCRRTHADAREAYDRAAQGLARSQDGLDELHRRTHAHRRARERLDELRAALDAPRLAAGELDGHARSLAERCAALDTERARLSRELEAAERHAAERARAMAALGALEAALDDDDARDAAPLSRARVALVTLDRREALLARRDEIGRELAEARRLSERQAAARARAAALGVDTDRADAERALIERVRATEAALAEAEAEERRQRELTERAHRDAARAEAERAALEARAARWTRCAASAGRLAQALGADAVASEALAALEQRVADRLRAAHARRHALGEERERCLQQATELDAASGAVPELILRLRDELGGELVSARYEELDLERAGAVEARLGPLALGIVVADPERAARELLAGDGDLPPELHLVAAGAALAADPGDELAGRAVVTPTATGVRLTPVPAAPTLGRHARARRAAELRARAETCGAELDALLTELHGLEVLRRDAACLADNHEAVAAGDPAGALAALGDELERAHRAAGTHVAHAEACARRANASRRELDALRGLLPEAMLLGPPDHRPRAEALSRSIAQLSDADRLLTALAAPRQTLAEHLDALRSEPVGSRDEHAAALAALAAERDRLFRLREAVAELRDCLPALAWGDAETALSDATELIPALEAQHARARDAARDAGDTLAAADEARARAAEMWHARDGERAASGAMRDRLAAELRELDAEAPAADAPIDDDAERHAHALERELLALVEASARDRERSVRADERAQLAERELAAAERSAAPAEAAWIALRDADERGSLVQGALAELDERARGSGAAELAADAGGKLALLLDRAARARGGEALVAALEDVARAAEVTSGELALARWRRVRAWVSQRVPAQVAQVDDPLLALERLRDHLSVLEARLARQEVDLRSASADISRGIEVQLRRAAWQVRRLNQHLTGIAFGSVAGIRIELGRVERMDQILCALREGETQALLFQASLPVEEALDELFKRYGGGRGGGQRLLDYREYLELRVEIQRRGKDEWEPASPTRLSTGEAIGVGAALMMVVLTEWERDANLLRSRRTGGSLRFLFLDEANRLSRDNLGVLFDLCRTLDLQLLIAAPEVAQAEGNTTYRLVRRVADDGREEVLVSGRRAITEPAA